MLESTVLNLILTVAITSISDLVLQIYKTLQLFTRHRELDFTNFKVKTRDLMIIVQTEQEKS